MNNKRYHKKREWHSKLPENTTLGMALTKAMALQREELRERSIATYDWLDILKNGGKITFTAAGAHITLPPPVKHTHHKKRVYLGE